MDSDAQSSKCRETEDMIKIIPSEDVGHTLAPLIQRGCIYSLSIFLICGQLTVEVDSTRITQEFFFFGMFHICLSSGSIAVSEKSL